MANKKQLITDLFTEVTQLFEMQKGDCNEEVTTADISVVDQPVSITKPKVNKFMESEIKRSKQFIKESIDPKATYKLTARGKKLLEEYSKWVEVLKGAKQLFGYFTHIDPLKERSDMTKLGQIATVIYFASNYGKADTISGKLLARDPHFTVDGGYVEQI